MSGFEKLQAFAAAMRPAMLDLVFALECLLGLVVIGGIAMLYAVWASGMSFSGKASREAAIEQMNHNEG